MSSLSSLKDERDFNLHQHSARLGRATSLIYGESNDITD